MSLDRIEGKIDKLHEEIVEVKTQTMLTKASVRSMKEDIADIETELEPVKDHVKFIKKAGTISVAAVALLAALATLFTKLGLI